MNACIIWGSKNVLLNKKQDTKISEWMKNGSIWLYHNKPTKKNQHCGIIFERQEWQPMSLLKILAVRLFPSEAPLPHTMKF